MSPNFLKRFDGTERTPRTTQIETLEWLQNNWNTTDIFFIQMPVGGGKSGWLRAVQLKTGALYLTAQNTLLDQLKESYPNLYILKGKANYQCKEVKSYTCADTSKATKGEYCPGCPYNEAKNAALAGIPTATNLMAYYYLQYNEMYTPPDVLLVDEAHSILDTLRGMTSKVFSQLDYDFTLEDCKNLISINAWLHGLQKTLSEMSKLYELAGDYAKADAIYEEMDRIRFIRDAITDEPSNFNYDVIKEKNYYKLHIQPIKTPKSLLRRALNGKKLIFTSGTLLEHTIEELADGRPYKFLDLESEIPVENRLIKFKTLAVKANKDTDPKQYMIKIKELLNEHKHLNTVIHVTYNLQEQLVPLFDRPFVHNTQSNKQEIIEKFTKDGGIFLAAGCAEGLDFKDDLCRIQIIPKLPFPNQGDLAVRKRKAMPDGEIWYVLETMKQVIQMAGRSTRGATDWSTVYILDPMLPTIINRYKKYLPKSFVDCIKWR